MPYNEKQQSQERDFLPNGLPCPMSISIDDLEAIIEEVKVDFVKLFPPEEIERITSFLYGVLFARQYLCAVTNGEVA